MVQNKLILISDFRNETEVDLFTEPTSNILDEHDFERPEYVYADKSYRFKLMNIDLNHIDDLEVYINDEKVECNYNGAEWTFSRGMNRQDYIFRNIIGFVCINIRIYNSDNSITDLYTKHLSVMVPRNQPTGHISSMLEYVYKNQENLLIVGNSDSRIPGNIKSGKFINLDTKITLAENILKVYKNSFGYFNANSRFKMDVKYAVEDSNKLQNMTHNILQYIATHPGYLEEAKAGTGIHLSNKNYIPSKTLIEKKIYSLDIYENRIIKGFIRRMLSDLEDIINSIKKLKITSTLRNNSNSEYIHSSFFIFEKTYASLDANLKRVKDLYNEYEVVYNLYCSIFTGVKDENVNNAPKPSAIFQSVPQYHNLFRQIQEWFRYGVYSFNEERFILEFMSVSTLYEVYVLAKLVDAIEGSGYELEKQFKYSYPVRSASYYSNTMCNNTFLFKAGNEEITLYYQPVVFDGRTRKTNDINLYRNNSLSVNYVNTNNRGTYYYTPDYLIKYKKGNEEKYIIIDAKYSDINYVKNNQIVSLVYKYLFSLSSRSSCDVLGMSVIYGKGSEREQNESIYNLVMPGHNVEPFVNLVSISPLDSNEFHLHNLKKIISDMS